MADFRSCIPYVLGNEGGFQDMRGDKGNYYKGQLLGTKYGISAPVAVAYGWPPNQSLASMPQSFAERVWEAGYWGGLDGVQDNDVAAKILDIRASGPGRADKYIQQALINAGYKIPPTGKLDAATLAALNSMDKGTAQALLSQAQAQIYSDSTARNPGQQQFMPSWMRRAAKTPSGGTVSLPGNAALGSSSGTNQQVVEIAPNDVDAQRNFAIPLTADVLLGTPITPVQVIDEGLDLALWWQKDPTQAGGLIQNPHLRGVPAPAWFELRLNRADGSSLSGPDGRPLQIRLNTSLQSLSTKMQHIIAREPTATGLMISMWGSQPDTIVGRGTTGAFINQFGLTALMSSRLTAKAANWYGLLVAAHDDPRLRQTLLGGGNDTNAFRVAAQDAFAELLALFKNNGVTRFLPLSWAESYTERINRSGGNGGVSSLTYKTASDMQDRSAAGGDQVWSPAAGATGFQMLARAGDVHTRGYVAFRYKGKCLLGYFKSFNFTASADTPFRWDFDFTFRVLKSIDPVYVSSNG